MTSFTHHSPGAGPAAPLRFVQSGHRRGKMVGRGGERLRELGDGQRQPRLAALGAEPERPSGSAGSAGGARYRAWSCSARRPPRTARRGSGSHPYGSRPSRPFRPAILATCSRAEPNAATSVGRSLASPGSSAVLAKTGRSSASIRRSRGRNLSRSPSTRWRTTSMTRPLARRRRLRGVGSAGRRASAPAAVAGAAASPAISSSRSVIANVGFLTARAAHGAQHLGRVGPDLEVVADRDPAHHAVAIEHDGRRARDVLAVRARLAGAPVRSAASRRDRGRLTKR